MNGNKLFFAKVGMMGRLSNHSGDKNMDSKTLLLAYMRAKKYSQFQEVAADLGFTTSYISAVNKGKSQLTDATAKKMAEEAGLDVSEVLLSMAAVRATDPELKQAWYDILAKYSKGAGTAVALAAAVFLSPVNGPDLTAHNVYYVKCHMLVSCYRQLNCV
ncbi:helix-turn-helix domain-containing protein [Aeromonas rivipollensis]|uniref:helix-turn-helix domain-containing protein n=1 Tax=Aeromonas rivipollensis TaxID=948519 RepID=UPI0027D99DB5|nr:helix-turn-helix domain-containing protein [uncultured Aeromonas sp.]MDU1141969.1 helix-turn-helix domain-containing protein [Aeromonas hydrophila]